MLHNYFLMHLKEGNQESRVSIAIGYGLDSQGVGFQLPMGKRFFFASCPMVIGTSFPWREADHSQPISPKVRNKWIYTSTPPCIFMV
jgi:hypothetical protein